MNSFRFGLLSLVLAASFLSPGHAAPSPVRAGVSGRTLADELAAVADSAGAAEVSRLLRAADPGTAGAGPLTESGAVDLLRIAGVAASTNHPDRVLTRERANALLREFTASLGAHGRPGTARATGVSADVDTCFQEKNHGLCVDCCKGLGGSASSCAKACFIINKPSASEPLP